MNMLVSLGESSLKWPCLQTSCHCFFGNDMDMCFVTHSPDILERKVL